MFIAEKFSGPSHAGLYFVEYQEQTTAIAQLAETPQIIFVRHIDATLTLDGFHENAHRFLRVDRLLGSPQVIKGDLAKAFRQRVIPRPYLFLARRR